MNLRCSETVILSIKFQNNLPQCSHTMRQSRLETENTLEYFRTRYCPVNFKRTSMDEPPTISWTQDSKYILFDMEHRFSPLYLYQTTQIFGQ